MKENNTSSTATDHYDGIERFEAETRNFRQPARLRFFFGRRRWKCSESYSLLSS